MTRLSLISTGTAFAKRYLAFAKGFDKRQYVLWAEGGGGCRREKFSWMADVLGFSQSGSGGSATWE
jgi:hypothetical protein